MTNEHELTAVDQNELLAVEGGTAASQTTESATAYDVYVVSYLVSTSLGGHRS